MKDEELPDSGAANEPRADGTELGSPFAQPTAKPLRLTILHLMIVMVWSGVALAVLKALLPFFGGMAAAPSLMSAWGIFYSLRSGLALAGLTILILHRRQAGPPLFHAPGHWLILPAVIQTVGYGLVVPLVFVFESSTMWLYVVIMGLAAVSDLAVNGLAARWCRQMTMWRVHFIARAVASGLQLFSYGGGLLIAAIGMGRMVMGVLSVIPLLSQVVVPLWLFVVVLLDLKTRRDWIHWLGVVVVLSSAALTILFYAAAMLFR